jgi:hypothetical protein
MPSIVIIAIVLLLPVCRDVVSCLSCYLETKGRAPRSPGSAGERPRSISPDRVTLRHALLFLLQKANYYWQLVTAVALLGRLYLRPKRTTDRDVAQLVVNTSLMTWVSTKKLEDGAVVATLTIEGFAFPLVPDRYDGRLVVETELRIEGRGAPGDSPPFEARTLRFELDGVSIDSTDEQLSILAIMISSVTHPVIHGFNNVMYESHADRRLQAFDDLFLHGQYLNWCAWFWPGLLFRIACPRGHHWYKRVLAWNAQLALPVHDRASMALLSPYSRSVRFLLGARPVLARLRSRYELPVHGEALFICTVLHAVDHVSCDLHTRGHLMRHEKLPNQGFYNLIALLFYRPAQHFWTNLLRDKRGKNALYGEMYAGLRELDAGLADEVTLSISY